MPAIEVPVVGGSAKETSERKASQRLCGVVLVTDGFPNLGLTDPELIVSATRHAMEAVGRCFMFALGVGTTHSSALLRKLAEDTSTTGGGYVFVPEPTNEALGDALGECLDAMLTTVAQDVQLTVSDSAAPSLVLAGHEFNVGDSFFPVNLGSIRSGGCKHVVFNPKSSSSSASVLEKASASASASAGAGAASGGSVKCILHYYDVREGKSCTHTTRVTREAPPPSSSTWRRQRQCAVEIAAARTALDVLSLRAPSRVSLTQAALQHAAAVMGAGARSRAPAVGADLRLLAATAASEARFRACGGDHALHAFAHTHSRQHHPAALEPLRRWLRKHVESAAATEAAGGLGSASTAPAAAAEGAASSRARGTSAGRHRRTTPAFPGTNTVTPSSFSPTRLLSKAADAGAAAGAVPTTNTNNSSSSSSDRYTFHRTIGRGTYGTIRVARDTVRGDEVAVKVLPNVGRNLTNALYACREAHLLRLLGRHPKIVTLRDALVEDAGGGRLDVMLVMELMDCDLEHVVRSSQVLTGKHVKFILYQVLLGLHHMHCSGVVHRDLKPANILLNDKCEVRIADLGLARRLSIDALTLRSSSSSSQQQQQEHHQQVQGGDAEEEEEDLAAGEVGATEYVITRFYRPPELLLASGHYDGTVDIWSLGCIFAEMMIRRPLFPGKDHVHQLRLILDVFGLPPREDIDRMQKADVREFLKSQPKRHHTGLGAKLAPDTPAQALALLQRMLQFTPSKRCAALEAIQHEYLATVCRTTDISTAEKAPRCCDFQRSRDMVLEHLFSELALCAAPTAKGGEGGREGRGSTSTTYSSEETSQLVPPPAPDSETAEGAVEVMPPSSSSHL